MKNKQTQRWLPKPMRCITACVYSFLLNVMIIGIVLSSGIRKIYLCISLPFLMLHIFLVVFSVLNWNSPVYINDERIMQYKYGKKVSFAYDEIEDIKLSNMFFIRAPWLITIKKGKDKISFEQTSKVYKAFISTCTNKDIIQKLKTLWGKCYLDL